MDALTALKREAERYRWEMITGEAREYRRREQRKRTLENISVWSLVAVALYVFGPALLRVAGEIWRG
jgi:hypothetical protein